jgi:hypothetical protein
MEIEKGKTFKFLKEKMEVSQQLKDNQKHFIHIKKDIINELKDNELTIEQLTQKLNLPKHEVVFYLMSLVKYGYIQVGTLDDMDEYFTYKIKK